MVCIEELLIGMVEEIKMIIYCGLSFEFLNIPNIIFYL